MKKFNKPIILFLTTPRCGTQWLAKNIGLLYAEKAIVRHEPILYDYYPKMNVGKFNNPLEPLQNPKLIKHFDFIKEVIQQNKIYVEIGWQTIAGISALYREFGDRLKLIHLYRNPVYVAASLVTHKWYTGLIKERYEKAEIDPFDEVALLSEYREKWDDLTLFEKSLYYWTEINLRALEIKHRYMDLQFYSLKFENLFMSNKAISRIILLEMLSFMELQYKEEMLNALDIKHDEYKNYYRDKIDWTSVYKHPQTIKLAEILNYSLDKDINLKRYQEPTALLVKRILKRKYSEFKTKNL